MDSRLGWMLPRLGWSAALAVGLALGACDGPTRPAPQPTSSGLPQPSNLLYINVEGRTALAPGETVQFTVTAGQADGSTRDLTQAPGLSWHTNNPGVIAISPSGMVTALAVGGATITVSFEGKTGVSAGIVVLRPGTYRLVGRPTPSACATRCAAPECRGISRHTPSRSTRSDWAAVRSARCAWAASS